MTSSYYVGHWYLWGNGDVVYRRYDYTSLDDASFRYGKCIEAPGTTKVALRKRGLKRGSFTTVKVWTAPM